MTISIDFFQNNEPSHGLYKRVNRNKMAIQSNARAHLPIFKQIRDFMSNLHLFIHELENARLKQGSKTLIMLKLKFGGHRNYEQMREATPDLLYEKYI